MPRQLRLEYGGAIYHVRNRGDRREDIFRDNQDRRRFLDTLGEACQKTRWQLHADCLLRNHFHLVLETPQANLVAGMKRLLGVYTKRFNIRHKWRGHLFAGRSKALLVEGGGGGYLRTVCDYAHLNPVRAKLIPPEAGLETFAWSSHGDYLKAPKKRPRRLRVDRLPGEKGIPRDSRAGRLACKRRMKRRRQEEESSDYGGLRRGWCVGREEFRREPLAAAADGAGANHYGRDRFETAEEKARRMTEREMKRLGGTDAELRKRKKGDRQQVKLARRLRKETTMTLAWIAQHLQMGSWGCLSNLLTDHEKTTNIEG